jgi:hypothetical protein
VAYFQGRSPALFTTKFAKLAVDKHSSLFWSNISDKDDEYKALTTHVLGCCHEKIIYFEMMGKKVTMHVSQAKWPLWWSILKFKFINFSLKDV